MVCQFLLYNKVNQLYIYIYPHISSSCVSLPPSLSHLSRWTQSTELISLCYVAASHQLSILHLVVYICPCHSLTWSQLTLPPPRVLRSNSMSASLFLSCPQVLQKHFFFLDSYLYVLAYDICFSLSDLLHLYDGLQVHPPH